MNDQEARWHAVRVRLLMLAEGPVTSWNKSGATGKPGHRILADITSHTRSIVDVYAARWQNALSHEARERVITDAWAHITHETGVERPRNVTAESEDDLRQRVLNAKGWSPEDIERSSQYLRTPGRTVRKWRRDAGQDPETGRTDETTARIKELAKYGKSVRQIADATGVPKSEVDRRLKRAA